MAFDPDSPSSAKGHELATYAQTQLDAMSAGSQLNSDVISDLQIIDAVLQSVIDSVGS